jgi:predicted DNA-binding transcriptional regulator AlpA
VSTTKRKKKRAAAKAAAAPPKVSKFASFAARTPVAQQQRALAGAAALVAQRRDLDARGGPPPAVRMLSKAEVLSIVGVTFPTIWAWMRAGTFPRSRAVCDKASMWLSTDIDAWIANLPIRKLKGDDVNAANSTEQKARAVSRVSAA